MIADHAGRRLGATPAGDATRFEVWAPRARAVAVQLDHRTVDLELGDGHDPTWSAIVDGVGHGDRYRFTIDGSAPLPDPASRHQPDGVHGPSAVVDPSVFTWHDSHWSGLDLSDAALYELHVGTFTAGGTFEDAITELDRLADLGITAIELMPVNAFPGRRNWGYDGVFVSAVQASYGGPEGLARFVDAAHSRRLAVVLDVVYNHFGPEGNVLGQYGPYLTDAYATPWGSAVNVAGAGSDQVRRFFIESAVGFVRDFHVDGFRLDAVHAIVDPTARPFLAELTAAARTAGAAAGRRVLVTAESSDNDPRLVVPPEDRGLGLDAVWNDDYHHALRTALTGEAHGYYADYRGVADLAVALDRRWVFDGRYSIARGRRHGAAAVDIDHRHLVVFAQNHDHVGNTPRGERLLYDAGPAEPRLRLAAAAVVLSPYTPMLFMGEEYGEPAPFPYFVDHGDPALLDAVRAGRAREFEGQQWAGAIADPADEGTYEAAILDPDRGGELPARRGLTAWYRRLIEVRRSVAVLTDPRARQRVLVDAEDHPCTIVVERSVDGRRSTLVMHFGDNPLDQATPEAMLGRSLSAASLLLDSADERWGSATTAATNMISPWSARLFVDESARPVDPPSSEDV